MSEFEVYAVAFICIAIVFVVIVAYVLGQIDGANAMHTEWLHATSVIVHRPRDRSPLPRSFTGTIRPTAEAMAAAQAWPKDNFEVVFDEPTELAPCACAEEVTRHG